MTTKSPKEAPRLDSLPPQGGPPPEGIKQALKHLELPSAIPVRQLADLTGISPVELIKLLMRSGVMASINKVIDFDTAAVVAADLGFEAVKRAEEPKGSSKLLQQLSTQVEDTSKLQPRPPVVTILGHVDHGKTTLLDAIRESNVAASEVGGITQHIGAYQVEYKGQKITFLDTPGHEAFTAMRARGAQATDIAILVVAADDGVMPQTVEAIHHAKAASVTIVVALNKIDKPGADPDRVITQLANEGLVPEAWGGDTIIIPVSAKQRKGIDDLLENVLIVAELKELKANPTSPAIGVVVEARLDKSKGPTATVLVQHGTLTIGDNIVVGDTWGRVKALIADTGRRVKKVEPASPVEVLGLQELPQAGDTLIAVPDEKTAKKVVEERKHQKEAQKTGVRPVSLEDLFSKIQAGEVKELALILKADVQGSVEAIRDSLSQLSTAKTKINFIHTGAASIIESDVLLAMASKAIIIGFNSRIEPGAKRLAEQEGVDVRFYNVIYTMVDDVRKALEGLLEPVYQEVVEGHAQVKAIFSVGRKTKVAGCLVTDGKISRSAKVSVLRSKATLFEGALSNLRRFKDDVREVPNGIECGITVEGFNDWQEGDIIESVIKERSP